MESRFKTRSESHITTFKRRNAVSKTTGHPEPQGTWQAAHCHFKHPARCVSRIGTHHRSIEPPLHLRCLHCVLPFFQGETGRKDWASSESLFSHHELPSFPEVWKKRRLGPPVNLCFLYHELFSPRRSRGRLPHHRHDAPSWRETTHTARNSDRLFSRLSIKTPIVC